MIEIVEGKGVGAGKSYYVCERLISHWRRGGTARVSESFHVKWDSCKAHVKERYGLILEDDQYRSVNGEDVARLHEVTEAGSEDCPLLIILDEAQDQLNARDWNDKGKRDLFSWCCQSRHDDNDLVFVSQFAANIDKQIRRLATFTWSIRNAKFHSIQGFGNTARLIQIATLGFNDGFYFVRSQLDYDGRTVLERNWVKADKALFGCYKSKSMALARKRAGVVAKKNLQYERGRSPMIKYIILGAIILGIYSGFKLMTGGNVFDAHGGKAKETQAEAKPVSVIPARSVNTTATPKPTYTVRRERWFYKGGGTLRLESGIYTHGRLSGEGWVEGIDEYIVRIRKPDGELLYIVGEEYPTSQISMPAALTDRIAATATPAETTEAPLVATPAP